MSSRCHVAVALLVWACATFSVISGQTMKCSYGERGSLTSTCYNATPTYFRATNYRFDNLDETLRCQECNLSTISSNTFDISGNQIINLDLRSSQIRVLRDSAFVGLVFLRRLLLDDNEINQMFQNTFRGIKKLELLSFDNNQLKALGDNYFSTLESLETLSLRNNSISIISPSAFSGLKSLRNLNLERNYITLVDDVFNVMPMLARLNLSTNSIVNLKPAKLNASIIELDMSNNSLQVIEDGAFIGLTSLVKLDLSSNNVTELRSGMLRGLYELEELNVSNNSIQAVPLKLFQTMHELHRLSFAYNNISSFTTGLFSGLPALRTLNVSHNRIDGLYRTGIFPLASLSTLDLSFNRLTDIDYSSLAHHMPRLGHLLIDANPIRCSVLKAMENFFIDDNIYLTIEKSADQMADVNCTAETEQQHKNAAMADEISAVGGEGDLLRNTPYANKYAVYTLFFILFAIVSAVGFFQYRIMQRMQDHGVMHYHSTANLMSSQDLESRGDC